jgi:flagellar basal-body rod modification protein FlgD
VNIATAFDVALPTAVSAPTNGATTQTTTPQLGQNDFLKLLVAQLQYQNPMQPVDSSQFMAQTAQFSMVEKLTDMASQTDALVAGEAAQRAAGLLGRQVTWNEADGHPATGVVTGTRLGSDGPTLILADHSTISLSDVTRVDLAPASASPTPASPTA